MALITRQSKGDLLTHTELDGNFTHLDGKIDSEESARTAADTTLDTRITTVEGQVDGKIGDLTTLTTTEKGTIVGAINELDAEIVDFISINRSTLDALSIGSIAGLQNALNGKIDDSQVLTNVPANAKFTDTVYSHPSTHPATMITTTDEFAYSNSTNVQDVLDDLDQAIANVNAKDPVITLTGDVTGSGTMTNLGNVSINATVGNDSHSHSNYVAKSGDTMTGDLSLSSGADINLGSGSAINLGVSGQDDYVFSWAPSTAFGLTFNTSPTNPTRGSYDFKTGSGNAIFTVPANSGNSTEFKYDGNTIFTDGYHPKADKLATARTINGVAFDGSANIEIAAGASATVDGVTGTVGLVRITDTNSGYRLDRDVLANKGVLGDGAVDLSYSNSSSTTKGATGSKSTAIGQNTTASGYISTAIGYTTTASDSYSTAMGRNTTASGYISTAMGQNTTASGTHSTAMGNNTTASGNYSTAMGHTTRASASYSTAMGYNTTAFASYSTAMGQNTTASGTQSTAMGYGTTASGNYSTAMGHTTRASASYSTAMGYNTTASGVVSVSMGQYSQTSQDGCLGIGYEDFSVGYNPATKTDQNLKILLNGATGDGYFDGSADLGNADYAEYFEWVDGNPDNEDRRGFTVSLVGEKIKVAEENEVVIGVISAAPAIVGDSASLRWANKYELDEFGAKIMISYTMTEWTETIVETIGEGEDVREYTREENHSYHSDFIPEDLVVPSDAIIRSTDSNGKPLMGAKLNPNWDSSSEYIPRSDRKEWSPVGLLGKLYTRKDQVVGSNWIKLSDVNENIVRYLVR